MSSQDRSPIIESCAVISAQIEKISSQLDTAELNADEIRALRRCELEMSKLEATAWRILCEVTTSDALLVETDESVQRTDETIDALSLGLVPIKPPQRQYTNDFGFGVPGQHFG
jgi:hypothetical protein